jgi:magnesium-transporting ATPase (P-type)
MGFFDKYEDLDYNSKEEAHLLEKFNDYVNLERKISKRQFLEISDESKAGKFGKKFIISAMIQGAIVTGLTIALFLNQILIFNGNIENMFEFAFTDKSGIFFFGFVLQMGLTAGLATIGIFYNHIELGREKEFTKIRNIVSEIHLYGTNIFGNIITISLIFAGIATSTLYQTEFQYLLKAIPSLVYISAVCLVVVLGIGIIGTAAFHIRENKTD